VIEQPSRDAKSAATVKAEAEFVIDTAPIVQATWKTNRGAIKLCGTYDGAQSERVGAHVLHIEWWSGAAHHAGWWRSSIKRPGEWTKGYGPTPIPNAPPTEKARKQASLDAA
jgi:hypothetical protein